MVFGFELDGGLEHLHGCRVGRGFGAACLAIDTGHLGHGFDQTVGLLKQLGGLACGQAWQGRGHVEQVALVQLGHELTANVLQGPQAEQQQHGGHRQRALGALQDCIEQWAVDGNQESVERVALLAGDAATDQVAHQHGDQRDRQARCRRHGVGFGEGQRREQPPLLRLQREHRHKGQRDDQQREKQRGPDLGRRIADDLPALGTFQRLIGVGLLPVFQVLVCVLDHHHGCIHHGADGNGDASQRHDVGVHPLVVHDDESRQDAQGQRDDGHQGRAQVKQKDKAHHGHHGELFEQLV